MPKRPKPQVHNKTVRYQTHKLPVRLHRELCRIALGCHISMQAAVNAALELGVPYLIKSYGWEPLAPPPTTLPEEESDYGKGKAIDFGMEDE